ncbi:hypothetical protein [Luteolibacter marinus]|uniref:hypothetical protein n=1 Tax=Luteolibacter marinus TaxID=2776705 RepID=UPI001868F356|nr:hypothetical protein [Luteolibacter marinus]
MEAVLECLLRAGWIRRFARLGGGQWHVSWTDEAGAKASFLQLIFVAQDLEIPGRALLLRDSVLDGTFSGQRWGLEPIAAAEVSAFLRRLFDELPECGRGDFWQVFLEICVRHAPTRLDGI